jgi:hypothetical protein
MVSFHPFNNTTPHPTGGVETVLSLLQNERFLRGADKQTRRSCLHIFAKITKFVLTTLCYGTLALFKVCERFLAVYSLVSV